MSLLTADAEALALEAARDAQELLAITEPLPLDEVITDSAYVIRHGCTGSCHAGRGACDCGAEPITSAQQAAAAALAGWRGFFEVEWDHPALLPLYAILAVAFVAMWAFFPWGFAQP
jgi:hypothetical protein